MAVERTVDSREIYRGRVVSLRLDTVELPDGFRTTREIVVHGEAVGIVPVLPDGRVVLVRQFRKPAGAELIEIPAGGVEPGESPEGCARRELVEETGFSPGRLVPLAQFYLAPGYSTELMHLYLALELVPARGKAAPDERIELLTVPLAEAIALIECGEIRDCKTVAGLFLAREFLRREGGPR